LQKGFFYEKKVIELMKKDAVRHHLGKGKVCELPSGKRETSF